VAARFCDLDHVRPWPIGRTAARNLLSLCRRHHRIKQRPGWRLRLAADGTATWTDPTGRVRTTAPLNALESLVLVSEPSDNECHADSGHATDVPTTRSRADACPAEVDGQHLTDVDRRPITEVDGRPITEHPAHAKLATWSALESHLVIRLDHRAHHRPELDPWSHPTHRRCTSAADLRAGFARRLAGAPAPDLPPF